MKQVKPFYKSRRWHRVRAEVLRRDGYICRLSQRYGRTAAASTVHHIYPLSDYPEYAFARWNLISVSQETHNRLHNRADNTLTAEGEALRRATVPPTSATEK